MSVNDTYLLAYLAKTKLSYETSRNNHVLRLIVGHANLVDLLVDDLASAIRCGATPSGRSFIQGHEVRTRRSILRRRVSGGEEGLQYLTAEELLDRLDLKDCGSDKSGRGDATEEPPGIEVSSWRPATSRFQTSCINKTAGGDGDSLQDNEDWDPAKPNAFSSSSSFSALEDCDDSSDSSEDDHSNDSDGSNNSDDSDDIDDSDNEDDSSDDGNGDNDCNDDYETDFYRSRDGSDTDGANGEDGTTSDLCSCNSMSKTLAPQLLLPGLRPQRPPSSTNPSSGVKVLVQTIAACDRCPRLWSQRVAAEAMF